MKIDWGVVGGIVLLLFSAVFMIGLIMWTVDVAFGETDEMLPGWYYWLGLWLIGAFADETSCDNARRYQIEAGATAQYQVSLCYRITIKESSK